MSPPSSITIIGAGLSSLALSILLRRFLPSSTKITIYEVRPEDHPSSSGTINLTPNALRVLDHLGVYETVKAQGFNFDNLNMMNCDLDLLASIPIAGIKSYGYQSLRLERRAVHFALLNKVKGQGGVEIIYSSKCTSVVDTPTGVTVAFSNGTEITTDVLIACDGIHSTVRKFFMKDHPDAQTPEYTGQVSVGGFITASEIEKFNTKDVEYPIMMFGPEDDTGANFMIWPYTFDGTGLTFFTTITKKEEEPDWRLYSEDKGRLKKMLMDTFAREASPWNNLVKKTIELSDKEPYRFWAHYIHTLPEKLFSQTGKVIIIGDAAHAMPPSGGQGGAMAFEDAEALAYALHQACTAPNPGETEKSQDQAYLDALDKWSNHRLQRLRNIQDLNRKTAEMRKGATGSSSGVMFWVKSLLIRGLGALGLLGRSRRVVNNYDARLDMEAAFGVKLVEI
ncbi:hypothetical protein ABW19_dt0200540 [Dactylella cylindrospora]|nr:hypothetical protein ABW19_dt0200540 [Dactylella cylindrospora]